MAPGVFRGQLRQLVNPVAHLENHGYERVKYAVVSYLDGNEAYKVTILRQTPWWVGRSSIGSAKSFASNARATTCVTRPKYLLAMGLLTDL